MKYLPGFALATLIVCSMTLLKAEEIMLYSFEGKMDEGDGGFSWLQGSFFGDDFVYLDMDKAFNKDLTQPLDYRGGEMHVYMYIKNQPVPQEMKVCINLHQANPGGDHVHEIGTKREVVYGAANSEYSWVYEIDTYGGWTGDNFWVAWGRTDLYMDWSLPRARYTVRFWTPSDQEVHAAGGKNWSGEDPKKWFPLDFTYLVVIVEKGGVFSGWENYVDEAGHTLLKEREEEARAYFSGFRLLQREVVKSSWFGLINVLDFPITIHEDMGVLYCGGQGGDSLWMYSPMEGIGWFWTTPTYYPYIYLLESGTWAYYYEGTSAPAWFYLYKTNEWISGMPTDSF